MGRHISSEITRKIKSQLPILNADYGGTQMGRRFESMEGVPAPAAGAVAVLVLAGRSVLQLPSPGPDPRPRPPPPPDHTGLYHGMVILALRPDQRRIVGSHENGRLRSPAATAWRRK